MKTFLSTWWDRLRATYWLLPTLLAIGAIALSALTLHIDTGIKPRWARESAWIWAGGAEGARSMLATIASSTITVAGVVFSITIVTLTLASSQFGPRLLRNFMNDSGTQLVLGVFVATFLYCLLVLRAVRGTDQLTVVPYLSVTCGVAFAVASVGFLIFFIHHISSSIIAENVIGRVADDLQENIDRLYPRRLERDPGPTRSDALSELESNDAFVILARHSGFIQAIALDRLMQVAAEHDVTLRVLRRPGEFVAEGSRLAEVTPSSRADDALATKVDQQVFFGRDRTPTQDIEFSIDQLVEVAVRALSPGVNDPFTALSCVEWLGVALIRLAGREFPSGELRDEAGRVRVISGVSNFAGIVSAAFNQVRQYGSSSVAVSVRVMDVLGRTAPHLIRAEDRRVISEHLRAARSDSLAKTENVLDRSDIEAAFRVADRALTGAHVTLA